MKKNINEKTFELNITSELLNLSKSFIWYLREPNLISLFPLRNGADWSQFMNQATLFAEGLTQEEENNSTEGGYDVSINYTLPNGLEGRLMFLQYKAGIRKKYSNNKDSAFYGETARQEQRTPGHVMFAFNDAAEGTQHSTLRTLANRVDIQSESVMYVFPRITERNDFNSKIGTLIRNSSFVPVLELDNQASNQTPPISINDGESHKYRTSYDGLTSEVNFFFFPFYYDKSIISQLLSELICIQIERFARILLERERPLLNLFVDVLSDSIYRFEEYELQSYPSSALVIVSVNSYISQIKEQLSSNREIPVAPSKFTIIIPREGLRMNIDDESDFSSIHYQLF